MSCQHPPVFGRGFLGLPMSNYMFKPTAGTTLRFAPEACRGQRRLNMALDPRMQHWECRQLSLLFFERSMRMSSGSIEFAKVQVQGGGLSDISSTEAGH